MISKATFYILSISLFLAIYLLLFTSLQVLSLLAALVFVASLFKFLDDLGNNLSVKGLLMLIASAQWLLGPILTYYSSFSHGYYNMYVEEEFYMSFVLTGTCLYFAFLLLPVSEKSLQAAASAPERVEVHLQENVKSNVGLWFVFIGIASSFAGNYAPASLGFLFYILKNFQFIGAYYLLFSDHKYKVHIIVLVISRLLLSSISAGMFHDLVLWVTFMVIIILLKYKMKLWVKFSGFALAVFLLLGLQSIKSEFRSYVWYGGHVQNETTLFYDLLSKKILNHESLFEQNVLNNALYRLNQGWIISNIMHHVPDNEPYAEGETILKSFKESFLPRVIVGDKMRAGGHEYFERFTGQPLPEYVSMNLSVIGEAYANFGAWGGVVFMCLFGLFINIVLTRVFQLSLSYPTIIFWIPLLMQEFVKAENDFNTGINHFMKSMVIIFFTYWTARRVFKVSI